ncbi:YjbF family lipoprotein [Cereibacter changlensis]|uniref:YjbF family lipoprotein n=1 Tax=Cereibacter changlensis TaxID=402884 RepID=UPI004033C034
MRLLFLIPLLLLAGCGSDEQSSDRVRLLRAALGAVTDRDQNRPLRPEEMGLTRAALAGVTTPLALATVEATGASALLAPFGSNGGVTTWSSADHKTLALRDGVLLATRGLGPDLMSSEAPTAAQIARGRGQHDRVHYQLDGLDRTLRLPFRCALATRGERMIEVIGRNYRTTLVEERCEGPGGRFTNEFWLESGGTIRQSRQIFDQKLGRILLQRIVD